MLHFCTIVLTVGSPTRTKSLLLHFNDHRRHLCPCRACVSHRLSLFFLTLTTHHASDWVDAYDHYSLHLEDRHRRLATAVEWYLLARAARHTNVPLCPTKSAKRYSSIGGTSASAGPTKNAPLWAQAVWVKMGGDKHTESEVCVNGFQAAREMYEYSNFPD